MASVEELNNQPLFREIVESVRLHLRDYERLNRLTKGLDHSDRHIAFAVLATLSDWRTTPPFVGQGSLSFIVDNGFQFLFIRCVCAYLLESLMFLHTRNFLSYSDGGINIQTENPQMLQATYQLLKNETEQKMKQALIAVNIENSLRAGPGIHSEYALINSFWGNL